MEVHVVIMLCPDDSEDNTQNMGVFSQLSAAEQIKQQLELDGLEVNIETWPVQ